MLCVVESPSVHLSCFVYMSRRSITTDESYPHQFKCDHLLLVCLRLDLKLVRFPAFPGQALRGQLNSLCVLREGPPPPTHSGSNGGLRQLRRPRSGLRRLRRQEVSFSPHFSCAVCPKPSSVGPQCVPPCCPPEPRCMLSRPRGSAARRWLSRPGRSGGRPRRAPGNHRGPRARRLAVSSRLT